MAPTVFAGKRILKSATAFKEQSDKEALLTDMLFCRLAYGFQPDEYLYFELEKQSMEQRKLWISDLDRYAYIYSMNDIKDTQIFNNKARTYSYYKEYYSRDVIRIRGEEDYKKYVAFINRHPVFVKKLVFGGMGKGVELVNICQLNTTEKIYFQKLIALGEHILEEKICAHEAISALNKSSVNTVRCITFNTREGVIIPYSFMKIGRNGSFVDNGGAGGILVGINPSTGIFETDGYDEEYTKYACHPDSKVKFKGYRLPDWGTLLELCKIMSAKTPNVKCIGWDMTYTEHGWIVVEGNGMTQMIGPQIVFHKPCKQEVVNIMQNMKLIVSI